MNAVGMPADALLDREPVLLQQRHQILRRLEFLEAQLAVAEDLIDHLLREVLHLLDLGRGLGLEIRDPLRIGWQVEGGVCARPAGAAASSLRKKRLPAAHVPTTISFTILMSIGSSEGPPHYRDDVAAMR